MKVFDIDLKKEYGLNGGTLTANLVDFPWDEKEHAPDWKRPAIIVVPGGGYGFVSKREAEPIALEFLSRGFHAFVLTYEIGGENGYPYPEQLLELSASVDYIKKHAKEWCVDENAVFAVGFSAGGHLTANLAVEYANVSEKYGKPLDCKPTAVGLAYPVISSIHGHMGTYENLLYGYSDEAKEELLKTLNLNEAVTENTVPAFIWTTVEDTCVPPDNALRFALALDQKGVPYELHVYPKGEHGLSTAKQEINFPISEEVRRASKWLDDCVEFFKNR